MTLGSHPYGDTDSDLKSKPSRYEIWELQAHLPDHLVRIGAGGYHCCGRAPGDALKSEDISAVRQIPCEI